MLWLHLGLLLRKFGLLFILKSGHTDQDPTYLDGLIFSQWPTTLLEIGSV